jgi:hypothetical protein
MDLQMPIDKDKHLDDELIVLEYEAETQTLFVSCNPSGVQHLQDMISYVAMKPGEHWELLEKLPLSIEPQHLHTEVITFFKLSHYPHRYTAQKEPLPSSDEPELILRYVGQQAVLASGNTVGLHWLCKKVAELADGAATTLALPQISDACFPFDPPRTQAPQHIRAIQMQYLA